MFRKISDAVNSLSGSWLIFIGAALWSTSGGVTKSFEMDAVMQACVRSLMAGVLLLPCLKPKQMVIDKWAVGYVVSFIAVIILILSSIRLTTAANALALQFTAPLWIFLWGLLVHRKRPSRLRIIIMAIMLLGIVVMLCEPNTGSNLLGNILGVCAGAAFAGVSVCLKQVRLGGNLSTIAFANICAGPIILLGLLLLPGYTMHVPSNAWLYIAYLAVFQLVGGYVFYMLGLRKVTPQKATILSIWEFILTPVWALLLVGELPTEYGAIGWVILLAAIMLENRMLPAEEEANTLSEAA